MRRRPPFLRQARCAAAALLALLGLSPAAADEVRVAVATNLLVTMEALAAAFQSQSAHKVVLISGSTGSHYALIKNGAPFDVFFAADAERPQRLEQEGVGVRGSRFLYAVGRLALWSAKPGFVDDAGRVLESTDYRHLAIANPALAPYGAAARDVLRARGLWDALQPRLVNGQDVGQAYSFVATGNAELGFVALSQLQRPDRPIEGSYWLVPAELHAPIEQHALLLHDTVPARAFVAFVTSSAGRTIARQYGYGP